MIRIDERTRSYVIETERTRIVDELHRLAGRCGHCGKRKCAGKKENSRLPDNLKLADVLKAIGTL